MSTMSDPDLKDVRGYGLPELFLGLLVSGTRYFFHMGVREGRMTRMSMK